VTLIPTPPPAWMRSTSRAALPDTCTIVRPAATAVLNTATGDLDPDDAEPIYTGPCRVRPRGSQEEDQLVGDLHQTLGPYVGTLPYDAADVQVDDQLTVTASSDADIVDRTFQVRHIGLSSWQIDRRVGLDDLEQPKGIEVGS
jgi:hypothetical protein